MSTEVLKLEVLASHRLSPHFHRLVVGGADLARLENLGYDQWFRMFFRRPDQPHLTLPFDGSDTWYSQLMDCPEESRPECRNYTIRHFRPEVGELDIDVVLHPDADGAFSTPASGWAVSAQPGEELGLLDQGVGYSADASRPVLLVADETALPAVEGILRSLPADTQGRAVIEVPSQADIRELSRPAGITVDWIARAESGASARIPGALTLDTLRAEPAPASDTAVCVAGEAELATGLRRHLVASGHDKGLIQFSGYWRADRPGDEEAAES